MNLLLIVSYLAVVLATISQAGTNAGAAEPQAALPAHGPAPVLVSRGAVSGVRQRILFFYEVNPDCTSVGIPAVHTLIPPQHGSLQVRNEEGYPNFAADSQRVECNLHKIPIIQLFYTSTAGYQGDDAATVSVIYPDGYRYVSRIDITVESADPVN